VLAAPARLGVARGDPGTPGKRTKNFFHAAAGWSATREAVFKQNAFLKRSASLCVGLRQSGSGLIHPSTRGSQTAVTPGYSQAYRTNRGTLLFSNRQRKTDKRYSSSSTSK